MTVKDNLALQLIPSLFSMIVLHYNGNHIYLTHLNDFLQSSDFPRKHDLSDAIAIVGLNALPKAIQDYSDYLHLKYNGKSDIVIGENIDVNNDNIHLNGATEVKETLEVKKDGTFKKDVNVEQTVTAKVLNATTAATGSFRTSDNKTVTVVNGIVTVIQ